MSCRASGLLDPEGVGQSEPGATPRARSAAARHPHHVPRPLAWAQIVRPLRGQDTLFFSGGHLRNADYFAFTSKQNSSSWSRRYSFPLATTSGAHTFPCGCRCFDAFGGFTRPSSFHPSLLASISTAVPSFSAYRYSRPSA